MATSTLDPPPSSRGPSLRVLYVDDNHDLTNSAVDLLRLAGFDVHACYDGRAALGEAAAYRPHLCLIDLNMPGMNGDELALRLREACGDPRPALIAVTAMSDEWNSKRILAAGFDRHWVKPVEPEKIIALAGKYQEALLTAGPADESDGDSTGVE